MSLTTDLYDRLAGDATLVAMLSTYQGEPAIFTADPVPPTAKFPFVVITGPESDVDAGYKNAAGRDVHRRVRAYTKATGSVDAVEAIASRIFTLLHRQPLGDAYVMDVRGPEMAPSDPDTYGRALVARALTLTP